MLKHSGFDARPHDIFPDALEAVFSHVDIPASMHLKLAPPNAPERNDLAHQGIPSRRKKERTAKTPTSIEFPTETAIPQGLSAKAAERLGIASPGACAPTIRRQRTMSTLTGTPEESEDELSEDDAFSSDGFSDSDGSLSAVSTRSPLERGASDWVAPDAWSGPATDNPPIRPPLQRMGSAPLLSSSSSKTITPSMSNKTITASSSSRTVKLASSARTLSQKPLSHTRNGSVASTASAQSTASASSYVSLGSFNEQDPGPQRYSEKTVQHPGLILWPSTFIPMPPQELQYHATKHAQTVLGCKPALEQFVKTFVDPVTEERYVSEKEFEDAMWDYESFLRPRFNWPQLAEARLEKDDDVDDLATPQSATFGPMSGFSVPGPVVDSRGRVTHPFGPHDLTHVRTFRVFGATKVGAGSALRKPTV
ncbi:Methyltransf-25 domain-containing protein [Mycena kentingensis (nom. inval.)]|nr:Methyltransf-25 domain-containing protein [Mycena kentingensis (nom. inval.)]